jgi:hypothetical protein
MYKVGLSSILNLVSRCFFFVTNFEFLIGLFCTSLILFKSWFKIIPHFTNPNTRRTCFIFECLIKFIMFCTTPNNTSELTPWVRISLSFHFPACMFQFLIHRTLYCKRIFFYPLNLGRELQSETAALSFCTRSPCCTLNKSKRCLWQLVPPEQEQRLDGFTVCTRGRWLTSFI